MCVPYLGDPVHFGAAVERGVSMDVSIKADVAQVKNAGDDPEQVLQTVSGRKAGVGSAFRPEPYPLILQLVFRLTHWLVTFQSPASRMSSNRQIIMLL